jgi:mycoredoxin
MSRNRCRIALGVVFVGLCVAASAAADVVVLKDGSRVETRGAMEVRGKRIVFTNAKGTLATLRLDEVDLEASRAASQPAPAAAKAGPSAAPKKAPVLVLNDRDVANADPAAESAAQAAPRVVMYATSWCGYCRKARQLLGQLGVQYEELDIEKSAAARSLRDSLDPSCGVPLIDFAGTTVCGFAEERIRQLAARLERRKAEAKAEASAAQTATAQSGGG